MSKTKDWPDYTAKIVPLHPGMTLDEAADAFAVNPSKVTGAQYLSIAEAYAADEMIQEGEVESIRAAVAAVKT